MIRFRPDTDEHICGKAIPSDRWHGDLACLRTDGHPGECVALARDAGIADGVHFCCRAPYDGPHSDICHLGKPCTHTEDCENCERSLGNKPTT